MPSSLRTVCHAYWLATQAEGYPLGAWVADRRDEGASWRQVSNELRDRTDGVLDLPPQTLLNWFGEEIGRSAA